mmetsp:Transcript_71879/g.208309  ORF Transcript_71879/g.208309 Transcript_71879/m.208309 type:complete len:273 (+) Transcript_71879:250-1068(+)
MTPVELVRRDAAVPPTTAAAADSGAGAGTAVAATRRQVACVGSGCAARAQPGRQCGGGGVERAPPGPQPHAAWIPEVLPQEGVYPEGRRRERGRLRLLAGREHKPRGHSSALPGLQQSPGPERGDALLGLARRLAPQRGSVIHGEGAVDLAGQFPQGGLEPRRQAADHEAKNGNCVQELAPRDATVPLDLGLQSPQPTLGMILARLLECGPAREEADGVGQAAAELHNTVRPALVGGEPLQGVVASAEHLQELHGVLLGQGTHLHGVVLQAA